MMKCLDISTELQHNNLDNVHNCSVWHVQQWENISTRIK